MSVKVNGGNGPTAVAYPLRPDVCFGSKADVGFKHRVPTTGLSATVVQRLSQVFEEGKHGADPLDRNKLHDVSHR